jgi:hypothetical protein
MMQFTVKAARLQRPMARTSPSSEVAWVEVLFCLLSLTARLYHKLEF